MLVVLAYVVLVVLPACAETGDSCDEHRRCTRYEYVPRADAAASRPVVVLIAGYAVSMVVWDDTFAALVAEGVPVLRFDLYGRGESGRVRAEYTPDLFADQMQGLLRRLGVATPVDVVASSMGGAVLARYANRFPQALRRVVLVSPAGLADAFPYVVTVLKTPGLGPWFFRSSFRTIMLDHLQDNFLRDVREYPAVATAFRRQLDVPGTAEAMYSTFRRTLLRDMTGEFQGFGRLRLPTRVVWGDADRLIPRDTATPMLSRVIPHGELCIVRQAAHLPQVERATEFNALVSAFLSGAADHPRYPCHR